MQELYNCLNLFPSTVHVCTLHAELCAICRKSLTLFYSGNKIPDSPNQSNSHDQPKVKSKGKANRYRSIILITPINFICWVNACIHVHYCKCVSGSIMQITINVSMIFVICHIYRYTFSWATTNFNVINNDINIVSFFTSNCYFAVLFSKAWRFRWRHWHWKNGIRRCKLWSRMNDCLSCTNWQSDTIITTYIHDSYV